MSLHSHRIFANENEKQSKSVNIKVESLFFNLHDVMRTVVVAKILHEAGASWNYNSAQCLHHIMKVEKLTFNSIYGRVSSISVSTEIEFDTCILPVFYGPDFKRKKNKICSGVF